MKSSVSTKSLQVYLSRRGLLQYMAYGCLGIPLLRTLMESDEACALSVGFKRAIFVYYPDGNIAERFFPKEEGRQGTFGEIAKPLLPFRDKLALVQGISMPIHGSHEAGAAFCLTGIDKTGIRYSIDSYLGDKLGESFRQKVIRLGVAANFQSGSDKHISYLSTGALAAIQDSPRVAFGDLFGTRQLSGDDQQKLLQGQKSLLDFARQEVTSLKERLGAVERRRLDDHLTALRELERRVSLVPGGSCRSQIDMRGLVFPAEETSYPKSYELNESFGLIGQIMMDLMVNALACGIAPVGLLQWSHAVSPTAFNFRGGPGHGASHHDTSHYGGDAFGPTANRFVEYQTWYMAQAAYLIKSLAETMVGDRSLLDETLLMFTTELGDSERHNFKDVACFLAGGAQGRLATGQFLKKEDLSYNRFLVTILQAMGLDQTTFGDPSLGQGPIAELLRS